MTAEIPIGDLIPTKIPGYADDADIQAALRLYHYGSYTYSPSNTSPANLVSPSIAKTIYDIQQDILTVDTTAIKNNIFTAKGQIITATASNSPTVLNVGTNNQFLIANSGTGTGLQWTNTLTAPSISIPTISGGITLSGSTTGSTVLQASSSATGVITLPAVTGTVITTGDSGTVTSTMIANNTIVNADINSAAAIAYSKLNLSNSIVNADISSTAEIAYSKLSLSNSIVNADISSSAAIANSKLANSSVTIGSTNISLGSTSTTLSGLSSVTSTSFVGTLTGNADTVTNGVYTTGTYSNPSWITSLDWSKISTTPTTLSGYGITDALSTSTSSTQSGYFGDIYLYDDATPSHYLQITNSANLTAARVLNINVNDADRTISLSGNLTVSATSTVSGTNTGDQTITLTGDVTGSGTGSFATTLANSGVTSGTYRSVTVDSKGRVTSGTNPTTLAGYEISDAQPLDDDLTAIAALSGTSGLLRKTALNTWSLDTATYVVSGSIVNADISASANIAVSKLAASTISGVTLGNNLNALTIGTGLSGTSYNGSAGVTIAIDSTVVTLAGTQTLTNKVLTTPQINLGAPNAQTGTTFTPALTDNGKIITLNNASAITVTVPTNTSVAYATGAQINLVQTGDGQVTVNGDTGVVVYSTPGNKFRAKYSAATLIKLDTNIWLLTGDLSA